jgi:uncharacterized protein (TIGR03437 family)
VKRTFLLTLLFLFASIFAHAQGGRGFSDEFNGTQLDRAKWDVFRGTPTVSDGTLTLKGGATEALRVDVQSKQSLLYGVLTIALKSTHWQPQSGVPNDQKTDSSFGVEIFAGANGGCHYSAILKADGHLGLLRPKPDANNNCTGDPPSEGQAHIPLSNWDAIRAGQRVVMMLIWTPESVTLRISDGDKLNGIAISAPNSQAVPNVPLRIRMNADINETYEVDYVRWAELPPPIKPFEFVKSTDGKLMIGERAFRLAGANTYYAQPEIAYDKAAEVREALDKMLALGMTVARTIGFNDHAYQNANPRCGGMTSEIAGDDPAAIQLRPGVYCEANLVALDQAIAEAKARNIRLILYLTNNFPEYGGKRRYVQWRLGAGSNPSDEQLGMFYTDATIKQWFKDYLTFLLRRENTITRVQYKDEPTILAWELGNELRNRTEVVSERARRADELLAWQREMAAHIKSLDTNHLLADGGEGFDDVPTNYEGLSNTYAVRGDESCSFSRLVREPLIELVSYHLYPQSWGLNDDRDVELWIRRHEQLARAAGKVAYLGEFGVKASDALRAPIYERWLRWAVEDYCSAGQLAWQLVYDARPDDDGFGVYVPRDGLTAAVLWRAAASSAAPSLAAVNAASYDGTMLAPEAIASVFSVGMAAAGTSQSASDLPLPTTLAGAQVVVRDATGTARPVSLFYVSPTQVNFMLPAETSLGVATLKAVLNGEFVACGVSSITNVAPGVFTANQDGKGAPAGFAIYVEPNGNQRREALSMADSTTMRQAPKPIIFGPENEIVILELYGTGLRGRSSSSAVSATIGGVAAAVEYADKHPRFVGLDQVNVRVPRALMGRGEVDLILTVDGKAANVVRIHIR